MDAVYMGLSISIITILVVSVFLVVSLIPVISSPQTKYTAEQSDSTITNAINLKNLNPEQRLEKLYDASAQAEIDRCFKNPDEILCYDTMNILRNSCKEQITYVTACNDPRLEIIDTG